jgi:hypothetical protein
MERGRHGGIASKGGLGTVFVAGCQVKGRRHL